MLSFSPTPPRASDPLRPPQASQVIRTDEERERERAREGLALGFPFLGLLPPSTPPPPPPPPPPPLFLCRARPGRGRPRPRPPCREAGGDRLSAAAAAAAGEEGEHVKVVCCAREGETGGRGMTGGMALAGDDNGNWGGVRKAYQYGFRLSYRGTSN